MSATDLAYDDDDDVPVFYPMGDGPLFLLTLVVFMVTVSLILFFFWLYIIVFHPMGDGPLFLLILFVFMVIVSLILFI